MFRRFAEAIGQLGLAHDARFASDEARTRNEAALRAIIEAWTSMRSVAEVVASLDAAGVPAAPIWSVADAARSQHVAARGLLAEVDHPTAGRIPLLMGPVQFSATPAGVSRPPPLLGEHSDSLLRELVGVASDEIDRLRAEGTI
jgi:crotonobetainyl-CoA:carnitine CoA-transferase CaiB-like acyl-CoA transferase